MSLRSFPRLPQVLLAVVLAALGACAVAQPGPGAPMTPQQREERWRQLSPEQRQQLWRGLSHEQKGEVIRNLSPEQRERLRERMDERRVERMSDGRKLSPEERQQLRDQINEANRDLRKRSTPERSGPRPPKER